MTLGKMRGHSAARQMEGGGGGEGGDEKLHSFLWNSPPMTQLCTLVGVHSGTWDNCGHGWGHFQNKRLQSTRLTHSPLHHTFSPFSAPSFPSHCLSLHLSSLLSPLRLSRDPACRMMSYALYESGIYLVGSARSGPPYISVTVHGCHGNRNAATTLLQIMYTANNLTFLLATFVYIYIYINHLSSYER